jgi:NAD(P)-dependent dehydrogenase (short-subunit alcohol dehydrogenase family)
MTTQEHHHYLLNINHHRWAGIDGARATCTAQIHIMAPTTPQKPYKRHEYDTINRHLFFNAFDSKSSLQGVAAIAHYPSLNIPPSTARRWLKECSEKGDLALRRSRRTSTISTDLARITDQNDRIHEKGYEEQVEELQLTSTNMSKSIIVITGSNTGLGFEAAKILLQKPYHLVITSRTLSKSQDAITALKNTATRATFSAYELDVGSPTSISSFAENLQKEFSHIDVLINNAGVALEYQLANPNDTSPAALAQKAEIYSQILNTNVVGPNILTTALLPLLLKSTSPRLLFISSALGSLSQCADPANPWYKVAVPMYRSSKSALNMQMLMWHKDLKDQNVDVYAVCPGHNATGLGGDAEEAKKFGATSPDVGGRVIADVVEGKRKGEEGRVVAGDGVVHPW